MLSDQDLILYSGHWEFRAAKWLCWVGSPLLLLIGFVANCLSAWILKSDIKRNGTHNYLLVLSIADQVTLLFGLFRSWISCLLGYDCYLISLEVCIGGNFLSTMATYFSVFLIAAVTLERVFVLLSRLPTPNTAVGRTRRIIGALLAVCLLLNAHWFVVLDVYDFHWQPGSNRTHRICDLRPRYASLKQLLAWSDFLLYSLIPISILVVCNILIIRKLYISKKFYSGQLNAVSDSIHLRPMAAADTHTVGESTSMMAAFGTPRSPTSPAVSTVRRHAPLQSHQASGLSRSANQVTLMLLLISFFFIFTSLPITVLKVLSSLSSVINFETNNDTVFYARYRLGLVCTELLMYANHSANFFLYCLVAKKFRQKFVRRFRAVCRCARDS